MRRSKLLGRILPGLAAVFVIGALFIGGMSVSAAKETLTGYTAKEIVAMMGAGFNFGNTLDAKDGSLSDPLSQEKSWGNPVITQEQMDDVAAAGFKTVRIPVTWYRYVSKDGTYTIDPVFMGRVKEVVDYAYNSGLFVIINLHHESWVNKADLDTGYEVTGEELAAIWSQIAAEFADYDQHLIFEAMNEPRMAGTSVEWSGNSAAYEAVNYLLQVFVDTVRGNGEGYNSERCLLMPGYAASNSVTVMKAINLPTYGGETVKNAIVSVHCYSPYNFCLNDSMVEFDPKSSSYTGEIDTMFKNIDRVFLSKGIPVIIGETGATNKDNTEAREAWADYMAGKAASYGVPVVLWDNGAKGKSGGECHAFLDRRNGGWLYPTVIASFINGYNNADFGSAASEVVELIPGESDGLLVGIVAWESKDGETMTGDEEKILADSSSYKDNFFGPERMQAIVYNGDGEPELTLRLKDGSTLRFARTGRDSILGKRVAYYGWLEIETAVAEAGFTQEDITGVGVFPKGGDITLYEISSVRATATGQSGKTVGGAIDFLSGTDKNDINEGAEGGSDGAGSSAEGAGSGSDGAGSSAEGAGSGSDGAGSSSDGAGSNAEGAGSGSDGAGSSADGAGSSADGAGSSAEGAGSGAEGTGSGSDGAGDSDTTGDDFFGNSAVVFAYVGGIAAVIALLIFGLSRLVMSLKKKAGSKSAKKDPETEAKDS